MENCTDIAYSDITYSRLLGTPFLARNGLMASVITYIRHARLTRVISQHVSITLLNARSTLQVPNRPIGSDIFINDNNNENDNDMASVHDNDNENEYIFAERKLNNKEKDCRRTE
jgi:hypothetical protein